MESNPLQQVFKTCEGLPTWPNADARSGYVIFTPGRTGSTLLTDALARTGVCGAPDEFFNADAVPYFSEGKSMSSLGEYIAYLMSRRSQGGHFGFKISAYRLAYLTKLVDFGAAFPPSCFQYIYLTRRDVVAQAFSLSHAIKSGVWHRSAIEAEDQVKMSEISDEDLWHQIGLVFEAESRFERFFAQNAMAPLRIDYGFLCANLIDVVARVLHHVGCSDQEIAEGLPRVTRDGFQRLNYDASRALRIHQFRTRYATMLDKLHKRRGQIGVSDVDEFLDEQLNAIPGPDGSGTTRPSIR